MPFTIGGEWIPSDKNSSNSKKVHIYKQKRKGRVYTIIANLNDVQQKLWLADLKKKCHCGGFIQDQCIELQGDHEKAVKEYLKQQG